jgi:hypothetical protein
VNWSHEITISMCAKQPDADPVVVMVARHGYTGELEIPHAYYNPVTLLELLDQHSGSAL